MMKEESTDLDLEAIHRRLNKIIGQCNGISRMIDRKAACADIILQVSAAKSALHRVGAPLGQPPEGVRARGRREE